MIDRIIVTGASSGLGKHICQELTKSGVRVIGLSRSKPLNTNFDSIQCDVSNHEEVKNTFKSIKRDFKPNGLINAAGIASMNLLITTPPEKMEQIINTNVLGTMFCCQQALKIFARSKDRSSIINFSTIAVNIALKGESVYVASKAAIEAFSRTLAKEAGANVLVSGSTVFKENQGNLEKNIGILRTN